MRPKKYSSEKITGWSHDMKGDTEKFIERFCELARKMFLFSSRWHFFTDDHLIPMEDYGTSTVFTMLVL